MSNVNYISTEGLEKLEEELKTRKTTTRREMAERISTAKEQGDLSENFDYQDAKDQQGENERRIAELEHQINNAVIVEQKEGADSISLGTSFTTELANGETKDFEIVGASETDPMNGKISNESPLGKAFLGAAAGKTVDFEGPSATISYKIISIR